MAKGYLLSEADRDKIAQAIMRTLHGRSGPYGRGGDGPTVHEEWQSSPEVYVARTPADGIPALLTLPPSGTGTGTANSYLPGGAECAVYQLVSTLPDVGSDVIDVLEQVEGLTRFVYNLDECDMPGDAWIRAIRDKFGSWFADYPCTDHFSSTSTTTTTTALDDACVGGCRWKCNTQKHWDLIGFGCEIRVGTGTNAVFWDVGTASGTLAFCHCTYPTYCCDVCGTTGEETVTPCSSWYNAEPFCGSTSSTTSSTTTTTIPGGGCSGCVWESVPVGPDEYEWQLVSSDCDPSIGCTVCIEPDADPSGDDTACTTNTTYCSPVEPPPTPSCGGSCEFICDGVGVWNLTGFGCEAGGGLICTCLAPFSQCECGIILNAPCVTPGPVSSTSTTSTTSHFGDCSGDCRWSWKMVIHHWTLLCTTCESACVCAQLPPFDGTVDDQTALEPCQTTTTGTSSTTSSTSTSTTTTCASNCTWICSGPFPFPGFNGTWEITSNSCDPGAGCFCQFPATQCTVANDGITAQVACAKKTTTSTTTTTTSSCTDGGDTACGTCTWIAYVSTLRPCDDSSNWLGLYLECDVGAGCKCQYPCGPPSHYDENCEDEIAASGGGSVTVIATTYCTSTTSTTTTMPTCGTCSFECSMGVWFQLGPGTCTLGCTCVIPGGTCLNGATITTNCQMT